MNQNQYREFTIWGERTTILTFRRFFEVYLLFPHTFLDILSGEIHFDPKNLRNRDPAFEEAFDCFCIGSRTQGYRQK